MTQKQAELFFSILFRGKHHIPNEIKEHGSGFSVNVKWSSFATFDGNLLTRFVLLCHDECVRGEIINNYFQGLKIVIWKRKREGIVSERHPTIEDAIRLFRDETPSDFIFNDK